MNYHSIVFDASGTCFVSGENDRGQLGVGHKNKINTFTTLPAPSSSSNNAKIKFVRVFCGEFFRFSKATPSSGIVLVIMAMASLA